MQLTLTQLQFWTLLLLLVTNLLGEKVASVPMGENEADSHELALHSLFDHAWILSQNISDLNMELRRFFSIREISAKMMFKIFSSTLKPYWTFMLEHLRRQESIIGELYPCHLFSHNTFYELDDSSRISLQEIPYLILSRVRTWNSTLHRVVPALEQMKGTSKFITSVAKEIKTDYEELLTCVRSIFSMVFPEIDENKGYNYWSDHIYFELPKTGVYKTVLYKLTYCLHVDTHTVAHYLTLFRCAIIGGDICSMSRV